MTNKKIILRFLGFIILTSPILFLYNNCGDVGSVEKSKSIESNQPGNGAGVQTEAQLSGELSYISDFGRVSGWAMDTQDKSATLTVEFFVNGPKNLGGELAGTTVANAVGGGSYNGHFFVFELPPQFKTGVVAELYVYGVRPGRQVTLASARRFAAYIPKAAGQAYYESTIKPLLLSRCTNCHGVDYMSQYYPLANPTPFKGGTRLSNELINKASGRSHGGGNRCGSGINSSPCAEFQVWWDLEFQ